MSKLFLRLAFLFMLLNSASLSAQIKLPRLLSDNAVLQRGVTIPLHGQAAKNASVKIVFADASYKVKANNNGEWRLELPPLKAGGPYDMKINDGQELLVVSNILVGDIWVCSGQSNMEWPLREANNAEAEIAAANDPMIRHFYVEHSAATQPQATLQSGKWNACDSTTAGDFTAVGYFFAKHLREKTGVPIGLLHSSWGGSRIEPWMDATTLGYKNAAEVEAYLEETMGGQKERVEAFLRSKFGDQIPMIDGGIQDGKAIWSYADFNDGDWLDYPLPGRWEENGWEMLDGIVWFRKEVTLTAAQAAEAATLGLAMIDDSDDAWVNGVRVGGLTNSYSVVRNYPVPKGTLRVGKNVIAVRVEDGGYGGGFHGKPDLMYLQTATGKLSLAGDWKMKVGKALGSLPTTNDNQLPTKLYNAMIHPIQWFPIKGVIWYQGESNAGEAAAYKSLFQQMIQQWRNQWRVGDFPFLFAQLANFHAVQPEPGDGGWAFIREAQSAALTLPNTGQAVITDIGEADDIHPRNKQDVGYRLALAARHFAYGEKDLIYSGPTFKGIAKSNAAATNQLHLEFENKGSGLLAKGSPEGELRGFAIAGADKKFVWAQAKIEGDKVVVWSEQVPTPVAVRYAWADNPGDANFYNQEGLPASSFRTDNW